MLFLAFQDSKVAAASSALPGHQKIAALVLAALILLVVVELVRRRKLREEYAIIWTVTALGLMVLAWQHEALNLFRRAIGAVESTSALFAGGLLFLMFVTLHISVRLSKLTFRNRTLSQRVALLENEIEDLRKDRQKPETRDSKQSHDGAA